MNLEKVHQKGFVVAVIVVPLTTTLCPAEIMLKNVVCVAWNVYASIAVRVMRIYGAFVTL